MQKGESSPEATDAVKAASAACKDVVKELGAEAVLQAAEPTARAIDSGVSLKDMASAGLGAAKTFNAAVHLAVPLVRQHLLWLRLHRR